MKLYEVWPSKNRFYFNGRFITGPKRDRLVNSFAWIAVVIFPIIHFSFILPEII